MVVVADAATRNFKRDALRAFVLFDSLRSEELDEIVAFAAERRTGKGTAIFEKDDAGSSMMVVLTGRVRIWNVSREGKEVTLRVIGPGEVFGEIALLDGKPRSANAEALEDTLLMVVERRHFLPFMMGHPGVLERLLVVLCDRLRSTSLDLEDQATLDMPARLARRLVRLARDYGRALPQGAVRIELKLSQNDLGNLIGTTRESVSKQLSAWRGDGIIGADGRYVIVTNMERLVAACQ